ncbi:MAG TPA: hypothetical protein VIW73_09240 [Candidatus Cybelea sp.]
MIGAITKTLRIGGAALTTIVAMSGCRSGNFAALPNPGSQPAGVSELARGDTGISPDVSILKQLKKQVVIGSAVDPSNGSQNPYGLTVAPVTAGKLTKGDLVICDFNGKSNVQGTGEAIIALHPAPKSKPMHVSSLEPLDGCDAVALDVDDSIWASVMVANDNPVLDSNGKLISNISGKPFTQPWGQILARRKSASAFYESNAGDGSIVRINVGSKFTWRRIATGFPVNHGKAGTVLAPSGLAYEEKIDTLYFANGMNNTIVAFKNVSTVPRDGIQAWHNGMRFKGPAAADARVVFAGKPLNGPISTALLPNGNLVVGNTLDPNGKNLIIEISSSGKVLAVRNVDKGALGALFGLVVTGSTIADTKVYFNDDNDNNVQVLER